MAQNIYDDPRFFSGYSQLPRQVHGLAGAPEWPALRARFPDVTDRHALDLGCGFGWVSRWLRDHGARSVLGVDVSRNMIARAQEMTADPAIDYRIADIETIELPGSAFDFAVSSLTFHYIRDFNRLVRTVYHALTPGSHFVFSIEHPIFMAATHTHWISDEDGRKTWPVNRYALEGERRTDWLAEGVVKYHRTIATTLNALIGVGFVIEAVSEFAPTSEQIRENPALEEELERPMMLLVSARR
ncbi:MAG TPA: class I SAM-dependent methyltransferase [Rhizobium sp.]|nr:class I SAM-dependent methyltransferase [Rhizobium sp.]